MLQPLLDNIGHVCWSSTLLEDESGLPRDLQSLRKHFVFEEFEVVLHHEPVPCWEPDWVLVHTIGSNDTKHHPAGRMLGLGNGPKLIHEVPVVPEAHILVVLAVVDWINSKYLLIREDDHPSNCSSMFPLIEEDTSSVELLVHKIHSQGWLLLAAKRDTTCFLHMPGDCGLGDADVMSKLCHCQTRTLLEGSDGIFPGQFSWAATPRSFSEILCSV